MRQLNRPHNLPTFSMLFKQFIEHRDYVSCFIGMTAEKGSDIPPRVGIRSFLRVPYARTRGKEDTIIDLSPEDSVIFDPKMTITIFVQPD